MSDDWTLLSLVRSSGFGASNSSLPCSSVNIFDFRKGVASKCLVHCASHRQSNCIVLCQPAGLKNKILGVAVVCFLACRALVFLALVVLASGPDRGRRVRRVAGEKE